jgi:hypothetical protein
MEMKYVYNAYGHKKESKIKKLVGFISNAMCIVAMITFFVVLYMLAMAEYQIYK